MKKTLAALMIGALILCSACGTATKSSDTTAKETATAKQTTTTAAKLGTKDNPVPLGTAAKVGDWTVKVTGFKPDATQEILDYNQFNDPPEAGKQYVLVSLEATYEGKESATFWVAMSYALLGSKGNTYRTSDTMAVAPKSIADANECFPGASISGNLLFAVDSDQITGALLMLEPSFSLEEQRVFFALQ